MNGEKRPGYDQRDAPDVKKTSLWTQVTHPGEWFKKGGEETVVMPPDEDQAEPVTSSESTDVSEPQDSDESNAPAEEELQKLAA